MRQHMRISRRFRRLLIQPFANRCQFCNEQFLERAWISKRKHLNVVRSIMFRCWYGEASKVTSKKRTFFFRLFKFWLLNNIFFVFFGFSYGTFFGRLEEFIRKNQLNQREGKPEISNEKKNCLMMQYANDTCYNF